MSVWAPFPGRMPQVPVGALNELQVSLVPLLQALQQQPVLSPFQLQLPHLRGPGAWGGGEASPLCSWLLCLPAWHDICPLFLPTSQPCPGDLTCASSSASRAWLCSSSAWSWVVPPWSCT